MVPPQGKGMTGSQRSTVEAALNAAFAEGKRFESADAVDEYLEKLISKDLLNSFSRDIFDCYLQLEATRDRQLPSPRLSDSVQLNTPNRSLDAEDSSEKSDIVTPVIDSEVTCSSSYLDPR
jgi:hypothetical protein